MTARARKTRAPTASGLAITLDREANVRWDLATAAAASAAAQGLTLVHFSAHRKRFVLGRIANRGCIGDV